MNELRFSHAFVAAIVANVIGGLIVVALLELGLHRRRHRAA